MEQISVLALEVLDDAVVLHLLGDSILDSSLEKSIVDSGQRAGVLVEDSVVSIELESGDQWVGGRFGRSEVSLLELVRRVLEVGFVLELVE